MGLNIELQDEWGTKIEEIGDPTNHLGRLLPRNDDDDHQLLAGIDSYGDTIFNRMQMRWFIPEWERLSVNAQSIAEQELVSKIKEMAHRVRDEAHLYLKFIGD